MNNYSTFYKLIIKYPTESDSYNPIRLESDTPFMCISVGDRIITDPESVFRIVSVEHMFYEEDGKMFHRIDVSTEAI